MSPKSVLPVGHSLLHKILKACNIWILNKYDRCLLRAILLLMYHGCLRIGEVADSNTTDHALKIENVMFVIVDQETVCQFTLKSFKFSKHPITLRIRPCSNVKVCPVANILVFLRYRDRSPRVFFTFANQKPVTRRWVADKL